MSDEERIVEHLSSGGNLNNTKCWELLGVERNRASYLLKKLHGSVAASNTSAMDAGQAG